MKRIPFILALLIQGACTTEDPVGSTFIDQLTSGAGKSKLWKIENAVLTNTASSTELTISDLANIRDDEFVFSSISGDDRNAHMTWNLRNEINANATKIQDVLLDYYLSSVNNELTVHDVEISTNNPNLQIDVISENKVSLRYKNGLSELKLDLIPGSLRIAQVPSRFEFEKITEITGKGLEQAAGFTGSMASNSLYIAYRYLEGDNPERVVKYDMTNNIFKTQDFVHPDFVTKELHIINDELKVVGARYVNTYSLSLDKDPVSVPHNLVLTRFGSTVLDKNIYLFGGALSTDPQIPTPDANQIYKHDQTTGQLNLVGNFPENRYWAHGEIVDGKMYSFGGRQAFVASAPEDDIFIWDISSGTTSILKMPKAMNRTFTSRYEHLIVVGGQREISNQNTNTFEIETTLGLFDTHDNTFKVIPPSIELSGSRTIYGLTVVGDALFILVGNVGEYSFAIYKADLN